LAALRDGATEVIAMSADAAFGWPDEMAARVDHLRREERFAQLQRSIAVYYDDLARAARMRSLLARFVRDGDLVFDVGSHVGDRVGVLRQLGARVVAFEPQPICRDWLQALFADVADVAIDGAAVGAAVGTTQFHLNEANPTVSTAADAFLKAADGAEGWADQRWNAVIEVPVTTLDLAISKFGMPRFVKIDVEGYEAEALAGLREPVELLSFEFTTIQTDVALTCLDRVAALGDYRFNISLGETHAMTFDTDVSAEAMARHVSDLPMSANSGDIYARRLA
jgi:FkbM family methyltransferase